MKHYSLVGCDAVCRRFGRTWSSIMYHDDGSHRLLWNIIRVRPDHTTSRPRMQPYS